ncbi:MAG TPA: hypothetical protein VFW25_10690 [Silvibacterium sp.]|nr:hypothetical protein [Silvibacterium sp.]
MGLPELARNLMTATTAENVSSTGVAPQVSLTDLYADKGMLVSRAEERNLFAAICLNVDSAEAAYKARRSRFRFAAKK